MKSRRTIAFVWLAVLCLCAASADAAPGYGKLSGVVVDPSGLPQMGATVWVLPENSSGLAGSQLLTNHRGQFSADRLRPGFYSVRVTLAGFLPSLERHIRVNSNLTTMLKVELDSVFTAFDRLRRRPESQQGDADEWKWVLRASAATRPVLQWLEGEAVEAGSRPASETARQRRPRARLELTNGTRRPGSVSNLADSPATAFAYDQKIGHTGRLLLAGQMSYERTAAAGIVTVWLPSGEFDQGSETTLVLRQAKLGPAGPVFRGLRLQQSDQLTLGDRLTLRYGAEYVMVGLGPAASALRPRGEVSIRLSPNWRVSMVLAAQPWSPADPDGIGAGRAADPLSSALAELDTLPAVLMRDGHPVLENGWHEELSFERQLGAQSKLQFAAFRDRARHVAVFGRGAVPGPDFLRDFFSHAFLYDGGSSNSWGARVGFRQKFSDELEVAATYAWAGALALEDLANSVDFRDALQTRYRHSLAARISGRLPRAGTRVSASYKWVNRPVVSRQDGFGEEAYQIQPYLHLSVRQPLPGSLRNAKWEALADFRNLLAQGYVPVNGREGQFIVVPALRSFRGGVSFQF